MATVEFRIRRIGTKIVTYPWMRHFVVIGPVNRHMRREATAVALGGILGATVRKARRRRSRLQ